MTLILSNALVSTLHFHSIYMVDNDLILEGTSIVIIRNVPSDALAKIAVATAEGKSFVEFENAELILEDNDE